MERDFERGAWVILMLCCAALIWLLVVWMHGLAMQNLDFGNFDMNECVSDGLALGRRVG